MTRTIAAMMSIVGRPAVVPQIDGAALGLEVWIPHLAIIVD